MKLHQTKLEKLQSNIIWWVNNPSISINIYKAVKTQVKLLEKFRQLSNFEHVQFINHLDEVNIWHQLEDTPIYISRGSKKEEYASILRFFNPSLTNEEIIQLLKDYSHRKQISILDKGCISQSSAAIVYLMKHKHLSLVNAFYTWYHSDTKEYVEVNSNMIDSKKAISLLKTELRTSDI